MYEDLDGQHTGTVTNAFAKTTPLDLTLASRFGMTVLSGVRVASKSSASTTNTVLGALSVVSGDMLEADDDAEVLAGGGSEDI